MAYILAVNASILSDSGPTCSVSDCIPLCSDSTVSAANCSGKNLTLIQPDSSCKFDPVNPGYTACLERVRKDLIVATIASFEQPTLLSKLGKKPYSPIPKTSQPIGSDLVFATTPEFLRSGAGQLLDLHRCRYRSFSYAFAIDLLGSMCHGMLRYPHSRSMGLTLRALKLTTGQTSSGPHSNPWGVGFELGTSRRSKLPDLRNPGFDFSQAQFAGNCPDPRTFMGGIRSD
ncbi:unnamed protein product [Camellia sinensis]